MEQERTVTVQRLQKSYEYENKKPFETIYLKHFNREAPLATTYTTRNQLSRPIPLFVSQFQDLHVNCGEKAHFSARVSPDNDPTLRVEFFFQNQKLQSDSKISTSLSLGLIELTILNVDINDAGIYLCRVYNDSGEAVSAAALSVTSRREYSHSIKAEYNQEHGQQIKQHKLIEEKTSQHSIDEQSKYLLQQQMLDSQRQMLIRQEESRKPRFIGVMNNLVLPEGTNGHFHCRLEPQDDSRLKIDWFFNGQPLITSPRTSSIFSNGYVALNIYCVKQSDSGVYTCRAHNDQGETTIQATMQVIPNKITPIHYDNSSKLYEIERQTVEQCNRIKQDLIELNKPDEKPIFITPLKDQLNKVEGSTALFEAHLEPRDSDIKISWFKDGQSLESASRISTFFNFGYVSLKIHHLNALRDSGTYTCVAQNNSGRAETSARLTIVENRIKVITESNIENGWDQIQHLESSKYTRKEETDTEYDEKPRFLTDFYGKTELYEGQTAHLEAKFTPQGDPRLKCEIFKDGQPLEYANRISIFFGFGYVSLKINHLNIERDSGLYEARISNRVGSDTVSTRLKVGVKSIERDAQYEEGLKRIQQLEMSTKYGREEYEEVEIKEKPKFITPLQGPESLLEGDHLHLEAKLVPVNDQTMRVEFYFNSELLSIGHRYKTLYEFGIVSIDLLSLIPEDSGVITVRAYNNYGQDVVSKRITVKGRDSIDRTKMFDVNIDQVREMRNEQMQQNKDFVDQTRKKPYFIQPLSQPKNPRVERSNVHFDARIEHLYDDTLKVEFLHNGQPLLTGSRVMVRYEFGLISLDIMCLTLTDSGEYTCVVCNDLGSVSSSARLEVIEESNIISSTQFPESLDKIQYLEHNKYKKHKFTEEVIDQSPRFTKELINIEVYEGTQVSFEGSVEPAADPNLNVMWYKDGVQLNQANRISLLFNFGYVVLTIKAAEFPRDSGIYTCVAVNEKGQAKTEAQLIVHQRGPSIVRDTQFEDGLKKIKYLEESSKYSRREYEDVEISEKPRFLAPLQDQRVHENDRCHFETRLVPVNDPSMKLTFLKDGQSLESANRISTTDNFGFVALDIKQCTLEQDSGIYTVIATNKFGSDKVEGRLEVIPKGSIISDNITEGGMQKIHYLENQSKYTREEIEDFQCTEKPMFLGPLQGPDVLWENQSCHFETKFRPVGDNTLRIEWYFNDKLLQKGHRFKTYNDFGFISLDILYVYPEDTGCYSVKLINKLGEAITSKDLLVKAIESIDRTKNYDVEIDKIRELKMRKKEEVEMITSEAPIFLTQIQPQIVDERETARFEARLTPITDNKLQTEWYKDGQLLKASHRIRTFHNFGLVWLEILDCLKHDEGMYKIRAFNELGQATSEATLQVRITGPDLILQTQLPAELAGTTEKIRQIEESKIVKEKSASLDQEQAHVEAPMFLEPLPDLIVREEETANFSTNLIPSNDPELVVSWFLNDQPLRSATRMKHTNDFGRITLEISPCYLPDEGIYKVRAQNKFGQAEVSGSLKVLTDKSIILDSQLPESIQQASINKIAKIEEHQKLKFYEAFTEEQQRLAQIPKFTVEYQEEIVEENNSVRFESNLTPTHDDSLKIEWFHNGKPIISSSRRKTFHDFDLVALEIRKVAEHDAGCYICRAYNDFGESIYKIILIVHTKKDVLIESQLPATFDTSQRQIDKFEQTTVRRTEFHIDDEIGMKPRFLTQIQESVEINESESFEFRCEIEPADDPDLEVIWFKNGEVLRTGTRIRQIKQFGVVSLKFDWTLEHDVGEYVCKIINKLGSDITKGVLRMRTKRNVILDPQVPENISLENIRRLENRHIVEREIVENPIYPPKFITPIQSLSVNESSVAHFECRLLPTNDPRLEVHFYFNDQPLPTGSRFITRHEFGLVSLTIMNCVDTDSGKYSIRAINQGGEDITETTLNVRSKPSLIYQTQLPNKTMELGIQRLTEMENKTAESEHDPDLNPANPTAPEFITEPEAHEVMEGESVRFSVRVQSNPKAKVFWVVNGETCVNGSKTKLSYDGMYHLDIKKTRLQDNGKVEIYAKNMVGEAYRCTTLSVRPKYDDYRAVLKASPRPWYDPKMKKYQIQRKQEEVTKVFDEKLTPGGTEVTRWTTEEENSERVKKQELLVDEQKMQTEQIIQQHKQVNQQSTQQKPQQQTREKTFIEKQKETVKIQPKMFTETETGVHGKQVHTQTQNQTQKQEIDNLEITRKLKTIEKRELERRIMNKNIYVKDNNEKIVPPELSIKLDPLEVFEGDRAVFRVQFNGIPTPKVSWYRENFLIQNSNDFQIETTQNTSTLTIRQVYTDDQGEYSVKVENKGGVEISRTNLLVSLPKNLGAANQPPTFTKTIQSLNAIAGELSRFDAIVVGAKPLEVHWEKNDQVLEASISYKLLNEGNHYTLLILETGVKDVGNYHCVARNNYGECRCEAQLNLISKTGESKATTSTQTKEKPPTVIEHLNSVQTKEGSSATFKARISNAKTEQVVWYKNGSVIKSSKFFRISNDRDLFILNITEAYPEDIGTYQVVATTSAGSVSSSGSLQLEHTENLIQPEQQVIHEPSQLRSQKIPTQQQTNKQQQIDAQQVSTSQQAITTTKPKQSLIQPPKIQPLQAQCAQKGSTIKFETTYTGCPTPLLTWYKDKKPLRFTREIQMMQDEKEKSCSLVINNVKDEHSGFYSLSGENESGQSKTTAQLLVVDDAEQIGETVVTTTTKNETGDVSTTQSKPKKKSSKKKK